MRRHPVVTTALATAVLLLVFLVPAAMATPGNGNPCHNGAKNPNCYPISSGGTTTYDFRPCPDGSGPPCAKGKSSIEPLGAAIPTGVAFLGLGAVVLGYLGWQRRQTLRLNT